MPTNYEWIDTPDGRVMAVKEDVQKMTATEGQTPGQALDAWLENYTVPTGKKFEFWFVGLSGIEKDA